MSYKDLYEYCQTIPPKIPRNIIRDKALALTEIPRVVEQWDSLNPTICRGYSLHTQNTESPIYQNHGAYLIVIARDQSYCWKRFVFVKELMHLFDTEDELTDNKDIFERVLTELGPGSPERSKQMNAEIRAIWMALGLFCPEELRKKLGLELKEGKTDSFAIATHLRIPQDHVPHLFSPHYPEIIRQILS